MSYLDSRFTNEIKNKITTIFELGSRDLLDANKLSQHYKCKVYAFECNPDCLLECKKNKNENVILIEKAVSLDDGQITFYPFDLNVYNNMGASSILKIDFSMRNKNDPDYNRPNPQKEIIVDSTRLDTFIDSIGGILPELICIDLQGYELQALKSLGDKIKNVKYIITECSIQSTYIGGSSFVELYEYLKLYGFEYKVSNAFNYSLPNIHLKGYSEFDALFINTFKQL